MKKIIQTIILILISASANATENLLATDFEGTWLTYGATPVKGEKQKLIIYKDNSSYFERKFDDVVQQYKAPTSDFALKEDLLIIKYYKKPNDLRYKLVISGWRSGKTYARSEERRVGKEC